MQRFQDLWNSSIGKAGRIGVVIAAGVVFTCLCMCALVIFQPDLSEPLGTPQAEATDQPANPTPDNRPTRAVATQRPTAEASPEQSDLQFPIIPGLSLTDVMSHAEGLGFSCDFPQKTGPNFITTCRKDGDAVQTVEIYSEDGETVNLISGTVNQPDPPTIDPLLPFLSDLAMIAYDGADPEQARTFVDEQVRIALAGGETTELLIGGVRFRVLGELTAIWLDIEVPE